MLARMTEPMPLAGVDLDALAARTERFPVPTCTRSANRRPWSRSPGAGTPGCRRCWPPTSKLPSLI